MILPWDNYKKIKKNLLEAYERQTVLTLENCLGKVVSFRQGWLKLIVNATVKK